MNLLQKQGFYNSIILYCGIALGFFNSIILFQRNLTLEEIGFFGLLISLTGLFAQVSSLGFSNIILRYFPYYQTPDKTHQGFITFVTLCCGLSFTAFTLLLLAFRSPIIQFYQEKKEAFLLVKYYYYLIPISFFTLVYSILEGLSRAVFHNVLSAFLREVLLRAFTSIGVLLIVFKLANYQNFIAIYLIANVVITLILWYSIYKGAHFKFSLFSAALKEKFRPMVNFGLFSVLSGGSFALIQYLDIIMLSALSKESLADVGIYTTLFAIAVVISMPAKALNRTSYQIISNAFKDADFDKISRIYQKTSVVQSLIGSLLLICLIVNWQNITLLLHKPEYADHFLVFLLVGLAFLADITGGLNGHIISSSPNYKIITYTLIIGVLVCGILNFLLIPTMGILGAALAYLLTMFGLNFTYWLYIKIKFSLQPFGKSHLLIVGVSAIALLIGYLIPNFPNFFIDVLVRSGVVIFSYTVLAYLLHISVDINELIDKLRQKFNL